MRIPNGLNRLLSVLYLRRRRVSWSGQVPHFNILNPPQFAVSVFGNLELGSGVKFFTHMGPTLIQVDRGATITVGRNVVFGSGVWIRAGQEIVIGDHTLIAPGVKILDSSMHQVSYLDARIHEPVRLGWNTWIGIDSVILPGVTIGEHSVVGAGSVVTRSVPSKTVVAGNPAKEIGKVTCPPDWIRGEY